MARDEADFLRRWSRRKLEAAKQAPATRPAADEPPPALPPLDSVTFDTDFRAFMHAKVEESVKRAALKKLFSDPRFNVMDGLDIYIDDYSKDDPIPQAMLEQLEHAKGALFGRGEEKAAEDAAAGAPREQAPAPEARAEQAADDRPEDPGKNGAAG